MQETWSGDQVLLRRSQCRDTKQRREENNKEVALYGLTNRQI